MTIKSYPWAKTGGGQYEPQTYSYEREMYERLWNNDGVIAGSRFKLAGSGSFNDPSCIVFESSPADLYSNVQLGEIMLKGAQARILAVETTQHSQNLSGNPRIDAVYLKRDDTTQLFSVVVSEGTPAASPTPTLLSDTATVAYYLMALITLASGGNITNANTINVRRYARPVGTLRAGKIIFDGVGSTGLHEDELYLNGALLKQDAYPDLYAAIGTAFNTGGEASDEFRLPDMQSRVPLFDGSGSGLTARSIADSGGAEAHSQTTATLAAHSHTTNFQLSNVGSAPSLNNNRLNNAQSTNSAGSGDPISLMNPYLAISGGIKI